MKNVTIIRDPFDPDSGQRFEGVDSVCGTIEQELGVWPDGGRIYDGAVAVERDVTPRCPEDVEALENPETGETIVVIYPEGPVLIITAIIAVAAIAATLLLIPSIPKLGNQQVGSANNQLSDRQNRSRPLGRIPDIYGQVRSTPDLIASPYTIFEVNQEIEVAVMCIGRGEFEITDVRDDTTPLNNIDGAAAEFYAPNTDMNTDAPFLSIGAAIDRNILTAKRITSVNGQVLEGVASTAGAWIGPYRIDLRGLDRISVNVVAVQGMFKDDGTQTSTSVTVELEVQPLDDAGVAIGSPITASGTVNGSATDRDLKAVTIQATLSDGIDRAEVRMRRTTPLDTVFEGTVVDEVKWRDLYGMAEIAVANFGDVTTVITETYGTAGALTLKNRKFNCLVTRKLPTRDGTGSTDYGFTTTFEATRNAAAALCHMALDSRIGRLNGGTPVSAGGTGEVDVPQIFDEVAAVVSYFGISVAGEFNYTFDRDDLTFQEMAQIVATTVFCEAFRRGSLLKLFFEKPQDTSSLLFTHTNKLPESETRTYTFGTLDDNDGVELVYTDPTDDALISLYVPQGEATANNPLKIEGLGIRGFEHAYLHAWRRWNRIQYRRLTEAFTGLQEGDLLVRRERYLSVDTTRSGVLDGEVLTQSGLVLTLSQIAVLDPLETYICFLQLSTGAVEAIAVTQGSSENQVILAQTPAATLVTGDGKAYRSTYMIVQDGSGLEAATPMLLSSKDAGEGWTVEIEGVNYDSRYYGNDLDFLGVDDGNNVDPDDTETIDGTPDPDVNIQITPPSTSTASNSPAITRVFNAFADGGAAPPSSFTWGVASGPGYIQSSSGATATLGVFVDTPGSQTAQFFCDIVIDAVTYRAYCTMTHNYTGSVDYDRPSDVNTDIP